MLLCQCTGTVDRLDGCRWRTIILSVSTAALSPTTAALSVCLSVCLSVLAMSTFTMRSSETPRHDGQTEWRLNPRCWSAMMSTATQSVRPSRASLHCCSVICINGPSTPENRSHNGQQQQQQWGGSSGQSAACRPATATDNRPMSPSTRALPLSPQREQSNYTRLDTWSITLRHNSSVIDCDWRQTENFLLQLPILE